MRRSKDPVRAVMLGASSVREPGTGRPNRLRARSLDWRTPLELVEEVRHVLGGISLDPCTEPCNPCGAGEIVCPPDDGRTVAWLDGTWCNPPFGSELPTWLAKVRIEAARGVRIGLLLSVTRTGTGYMQEVLAAEQLSCFQFLEGRLRFSEGKAANMDSWVLWFNVDPSRVSTYCGWRGRICVPL